MPSRILSEHSGVKPVPWLANQPSAAQAARTPRHEDGAPQRSRIAELEASIESKTTKAYEDGCRAGAEAARHQLEGEVQSAVQRLTATIADLASTRGETIRRAEADTVRLAMEIARRVLHRELTMNQLALEALVKAALEKLQSQEVYRVRVHPDQERTLKTCLEQTSRGQAIAVIPDPALSRGGVVFEISRGAMDASVETQLAEIERGLADQLEARA